MRNEVSTIIISNKDRFIRFGYDWFERLLSSYSVKIIVVNIDRNTLALCLQVFTDENYIQKINDGGVFGINVGRESYTLIISDGIFSLE